MIFWSVERAFLSWERAKYFETALPLGAGKSRTLELVKKARGYRESKMLSLRRPIHGAFSESGPPVFPVLTILRPVFRAKPSLPVVSEPCDLISGYFKRCCDLIPRMPAVFGFPWTRNWRQEGRAR